MTVLNKLFAVSTWVAAGALCAQTVDTPALIAAPVPGAAPKTYALVSAVGSVFQMVAAKYVTGSNIDPFRRLQLPVKDQALNYSVLRGLDRAVAQVDPGAKRILLTVPAADIEGLGQSQRAQAVSDDLLKRLQGFEQRMAWDEIIAVTPRYQHSGTSRMGDKLWGIGAYIYALESANIAGDNESGSSAIDIDITEDVRTPDQKRTTSKNYVAPYAYLRFTVYDAKTLKVLRTVDRLDARKMADPKCAATNVFNCFTPDQYAVMLDSIAETTAAAGIAGKVTGRVEMSDVKVVPIEPTTPKKP